jgi:hypothetical protein
MTKKLVFLVAAALLVFAPAVHAEMSYGQGPISCNIPLDSLNVTPCSTAKTNGHSGACTMEGTRNGKPYTVTMHFTGRDIPPQHLPPLKSNSFGKGAVQCQVTSSEPVTGKCNAHGDESGGSGSCTYCTQKSGCHQGSATISIREKKPGKTADAD